jgi:superfamily II DNA/RNA helicase
VLQLDKSLQVGLKELGFVRPTPIQAEAIPPANEPLAGICAWTEKPGAGRVLER